MFQDQASSEQPALTPTLIQGGIVGYSSSQSRIQLLALKDIIPFNPEILSLTCFVL